MLSYKSFFEPTSIKITEPAILSDSFGLQDSLGVEVIHLAVVLEVETNPLFIIDGNAYKMAVDIKMEPVFTESQNKDISVKRIVLYHGQQKLELYSSKTTLVTELYLKLKKQISHRGFNDYFKPLKRLGRGSFAAVYLIESKATGKKLAAKVFSRQGQKLGYKGRESLEKQIENLKKISHPNIIHFDGIYETDNLIYMVTEYLSGGTLVEFIRQNSLKIEEYIIDIVSDVLDALEYLKQNKIMHRDLKPENIVQRKEDNKWVLVDFGLAAYSNQAYLYDKCGTLGYMAPEIEDQTNSTKPYNEACDMYSFGVLLYELILGFLPFKVEMENMYDRKYTWEGLTKKQCSELHPEIVKLLKGLLQIDPSKRWTPTHCKESQFIKNPQVLKAWKAYRQKMNKQRYEKILKAREKN